MASLGSGSGAGDGSGAGYGSGYGDGDGYGSGDGSGYGSGSGYGDGSGSGYGYGYGSGVPVATLGKHEVRAIITPWGRAARVGCQVHGLDTWRKWWRAIAREHGVPVSAEEAARLIALIEEAPLGPEWLEVDNARADGARSADERPDDRNGD